MTKMNWNNVRKRGCSLEPKRVLALKLQRKAQLPATDKQKYFLKLNNIGHPKQTTKSQAHHLISSFIDKEKELMKIIQRRIERDRDKITT